MTTESKSNIYLILSVAFVLFCFTGCYSPQRIVKYEPENVFTGYKKEAEPPKIIVTNPQIGRRGIAIVANNDYSSINGYVVSNAKSVNLTINGESVSLDKEGAFSYKSLLSPGTNHVKLIAVNDDNKKTEKEIIIERDDNKIVAATPQKKETGSMRQSLVKPSMWVLSVGISRYENPALNLKYADNDAITLANTLKRSEGNIFKEVFTKTLVDSQATRGNILTTMTNHLGKAAPDDVVFIFLAGHGIKSIQTGSYYFLPYNADNQNLLYEGLKWSDFDEAIKIISTNVNKVILVLDTCHAGAINIAMRNVSSGEDLAATMKNATGLYVLSASKGGETSIEGNEFRLPGEKNGHGAFTYALLKGLNGEANTNRNSYLTVAELFSYVSSVVPRLTSGQQHPYSKIDGTDLPIASVK